MILPIGKIPRCLKDNRGMVLLEVLIAVLILTTGLVVVYRPLLMSLDVMNYADDRIEAKGLLLGQIWELHDEIAKAKNFTERTRAETLIGRKKTYHSEMTSQSLTEDDLLQRVTFRLSWDDMGRTQSITSEIYVTVPKSS